MGWLAVVGGWLMVDGVWLVVDFAGWQWVEAGCRLMGLYWGGWGLVGGRRGLFSSGWGWLAVDKEWGAVVGFVWRWMRAR